MKLLNGDCLEKMKELSDNSVDIVICDLPYGRFKHLEWDKMIDLKMMWEQTWRVCKINTPVFMFGDMKFGVELINSCPDHFKYEIVWNKNKTTTPLLSRKRFGKSTEYIFIFYKKQPVYNYQKYHKICEWRDEKNAKKDNPLQTHYKHSKHFVYEPRLPLNFITHYAVRNKKLIPNITEKPQFILEHLLKYFSNEGDTCLDMTMGSGSCGIACKTLNRNFIGIELNKKHFEVAKKRLNII
tara:strand:- start:607 stop:1326 length:720 start_codon:yes stop_codon:yes gene_type:complete